MLSVHNIQDFDLKAKGQAGDDRWVEIEFLTHDGPQRLTFFFDTMSHAGQKVERLRSLIEADRVLVDSPFFKETLDAGQ